MAAAATAGPVSASRRRAPVIAGFTAGVAAVAGAGLLTYRLSGTSAPADAPILHTAAPGAAAATGSHAPATAALARSEEAAAKAALERDPDDVGARMELARLLLDKQDYMAVWAETGRVLARHPDHPRALTYQSQVRLAMGQPQVALEMLKKAIAREPFLLQAHIYLGYVHLCLGQPREAEAAVAEAKRRYPAQAAWLDEGFQEMKTNVERFGPPTPASGPDPHAAVGAHTGDPQGGAATSPHGQADSPIVEVATVAPAGHGPGTAPAPEPAWLAAAPAIGSAVAIIKGTLDLAPALAHEVPAEAVVFVTVRPSSSPHGPPVAAKRLAATFPREFELGPADSMQGGAIPAEVVIEARIDIDGDASTREPSAPSARVEAVKSGASGVRLVLVR
jgi:tetratricopeptide (TPR) repeat protein